MATCMQKYSAVRKAASKKVQGLDTSVQHACDIRQGDADIRPSVHLLCFPATDEPFKGSGRMGRMDANDVQMLSRIGL